MQDDDDEVDELPVYRNVGVTRRAISAEAYGTWNKKADFVARVIPKTEEQKARLAQKLQSSLLFSSLDTRDMTVVIGAMEERSFKAGEPVIKQGDEGDNLYVVEAGTLTCMKRFVLTLVKFNRQKTKSRKFCGSIILGTPSGN